MERMLVCLALVALVGCNGSTSSPDSGSANPDTGGGGAPSCAAYCTASLANCASMEPQYADMASCMGACAALTPGTSTDTSGNTLGCRVYHTGAAATMPGMEHCLHGGPAGYGVCGTNQCEPFCQIALHACTGANQQWATMAACMTDCATYAGSTPDMPAGAPDYSTAETSGNTFACRMYHLTVASSSAANAATHCPHIVVASPVCM
jgi:hypothetical protein